MSIIQIDMEETIKNIGERIKTLRKRKHWTQDELAHHLEVALLLLVHMKEVLGSLLLKISLECPDTLMSV